MNIDSTPFWEVVMDVSRSVVSRRVVFVTDLHGNLRQYKLAFELALALRADVLIFGGDNAPKGRSTRTPAKQYAFFDKRFRPALQDFMQRRDAGGLLTQVVMIYGNDDFACYEDKLRALLVELGAHLLSEHVLTLAADLQIVGYSCVPITPFDRKDWERFEGCAPLRRDATTDGLVADWKGYWQVNANILAGCHTIQEGLDTLFAQVDRPAWLVCHAPPARTPLDMLYGGRHVGSVAVAKAIRRYKPELSFHGHIHCAYDVSCRFALRMGRTWAMNPGHHFDQKPLCAVVVDTPVRGKTDVRRVLVSSVQDIPHIVDELTIGEI